MSQTSASRFIDFCGQRREWSGVATDLSTIVYRSRAVQPLSGTELHWLTQIAQSRNIAESITGVIVYDQECFYQWLEGPRDSLDRVMDSIRNDCRHTDVEILDRQSVSLRQFGGWSMKLATHGSLAAPWEIDTIVASPAIMNGLHRHPDFAPALLAKLAPQSDAQPRQSVLADGSVAADKNALSAMPILHDVVRTGVIPSLVAAYATRPPLAPAYATRPPPVAAYAPKPFQASEPSMSHLARALFAGDPNPANNLLIQRRVHAASTQALLPSVIGPVACALGDLWQDDECTEFDVTIALCRLQNAVRLMGMDAIQADALDRPPPVVLITPHPGEGHLLKAALDADVLWHAGWAPQCEFPCSDAALQALVDDRWFDVLDLSLSLAFRREHRLARVAETIAKARLASRNPGLVVVVGGRIFSETGDACARAGADAGSGMGRPVDELILGALTGAQQGGVH